MDESRRPEWWDPAWDWLPVVAVVLVSQARIGLEEPWTGSDWSLAVGGLALGLPLALRRRWPLVSCALVGAAAFVQVFLGDSLHFGAFLAALVAVFAAAHRVPHLLSAVGGLTLTLTAAVGASRLVREPDSPVEFLFPVFYLGGTFVLGRVLRTFSERAVRLRELNAALAQERDTASRLSVTTERLRLSRELHDVVAHRMMLMVIQAEAGEQSVADDPVAARDAFRRIQEAGRQGLGELRGLVRVLRDVDAEVGPPRLADLGALVAVVGEAGLAVDVEQHGRIDHVAPDLQETLFRVVQEALTNVLKHSAASHAIVRVRTDDEAVTVEVSDPGPAAAAAWESGGLGLSGVGERLASYGGSCTAGPDGAGYRLRVVVPVGVTTR